MTALAILENTELISQGAEAVRDIRNTYHYRIRILSIPQRIYKSALYMNGPPILLKHRFSKQYRHRQLDAMLTKQRLSGEARALVRCLKFGVSVPGVRYVDLENGILGMEWIEGTTVRKILGDDTVSEGTELAITTPENEQVTSTQYGITSGMLSSGIWTSLISLVDELMKSIGDALARMHLADIIHGDLTTSNMMLRKAPDEAPEFVRVPFTCSPPYLTLAW
jgi:tRNA A-37 threonylcarbamoyl transferase component Bud32